MRDPESQFSITQEKAVQIALKHVEGNHDIDRSQQPNVRFIPVRFRPELDATTDAWQVSFLYKKAEDVWTSNDSLVLLVDVVSGKISIPMML